MYDYTADPKMSTLLQACATVGTVVVLTELTLVLKDHHENQTSLNWTSQVFI